MSTAASTNIHVLPQSRQQSSPGCHACSRKTLCPVASGPTGTENGNQHAQRVVRSGKTVFEAGDQFAGIYVVRSGFFKSYSIDDDGAMQVTGFHLPGEIFGMDGIEDGLHREYVEALDTSSVCRIPLAALDEFAETAGDAWPAHLMMSLVKLMSRTINRDHAMLFTLGKMCAKRRLGAFLLDLSTRMSPGGYSSTEFRLCMSRTDIANHLGLALETVSRLFSQLQSESTITIDGRNLKILQMENLSAAEGKPLRAKFMA